MGHCCHLSDRCSISISPTPQFCTCGRLPGLWSVARSPGISYGHKGLSTSWVLRLHLSHSCSSLQLRAPSCALGVWLGVQALVMGIKGSALSRCSGDMSPCSGQQHCGHSSSLSPASVSPSKRLHSRPMRDRGRVHL